MEFKTIYIAHLCAIAFLFPVFRQYKGYYFFFFLSLAFSSIFSHILFFAHINVNINLLMSAHLHLFSVHYRYCKVKTRIVFLVFYFIISFSLYFYSSFQVQFIYFIFLHITIIGFIFHRALMSIHKYLEIRIFYVALIIFETSVILKFVSILTQLHEGPYHFALTNAFEIFLAIFFMIFREDRPHFAYPLTKNKEFLEYRINSEQFKNWDV